MQKSDVSLKIYNINRTFACSLLKLFSTHKSTGFQDTLSKVRHSIPSKRDSEKPCLCTGSKTI